MKYLLIRYFNFNTLNDEINDTFIIFNSMYIKDTIKKIL